MPNETLNLNQPYGVLSPPKGGAWYEQEGIYYDINGDIVNEPGDDPTFVELITPDGSRSKRRFGTAVYCDPASATAADIVAALIAAGLMASAAIAETNRSAAISSGTGVATGASDFINTPPGAAGATGLGAAAGASSALSDAVGLAQGVATDAVVGEAA